MPCSLIMGPVAGTDDCDVCQTGLGVVCSTCSAGFYLLASGLCTATLPSCPATTWKMTDATQSTTVVCPNCE